MNLTETWIKTQQRPLCFFHGLVFGFANFNSIIRCKLNECKLYCMDRDNNA